MAGDIYTASGAKLYIGPSVLPSVDTAAEFAALTWTEVGLVESLGEYGDQANVVSGTALGDARVRKSKGASDAGDMQVTCFDDGSDPGQQAMSAAQMARGNYGFRVVLPNRLNASGTDEINYFRGKVMSRRRNVGANDNLVRRNYSIGIDSPIYEVPPTAGP